MTVLRLSDDMRRIVSFFVDNPPDDRLGLHAALEYIRIISDFWADELKNGHTPDPKDSSLVLKMSQGLADKADLHYTVPLFWTTVQEQLAKIHPDLKAK